MGPLGTSLTATWLVETLMAVMGWGWIWGWISTMMMMIMIFLMINVIDIFDMIVTIIIILVVSKRWPGEEGTVSFILGGWVSLKEALNKDINQFKWVSQNYNDHQLPLKKSDLASFNAPQPHKLPIWYLGHCIESIWQKLSSELWFWLMCLSVWKKNKKCASPEDTLIWHFEQPTKSIPYLSILASS